MLIEHHGVGRLTRTMSTTAAGPQYWKREELYEDVWQKPLTALTDKYGVSAVAIGKVCRKLQVPVPGRGYWAKLAHGHRVQKKPLPKTHDVPVITRYQRPVYLPVPPPPPKPPFPVEEEDKAEIADIEQGLASGAFVCKKPRKALRNALIVNSRNLLRHGFVSHSCRRTSPASMCACRRRA